MSNKIGVAIEKDEHGYFAYCPDLDGSHTQGDTFDEVVANIGYNQHDCSENEINITTSKRRILFC